MKLYQIQNALKNFEVTKFVDIQNYIIKLGKSGTITVSYRDGKFDSIIVDGKERDAIIRALKSWDTENTLCDI